MIGRLQVLAFLLLGGSACAAPVPPPPETFAGAQYIDGRGCVFSREAAGWAARVDNQGQPLCGFPPSLDVRRTNADAERALPLTAAPAPSVETLLLEQLSRDLRPGEWAADPVMPEVRTDPAPVRNPDPVQTMLQDALAMAPAMRQASGLSGSPELCARLGYQTDAGATQGSTLGLCPGMRANPATAALTVGQVAERPASVPAPAPVPVPPERTVARKPGPSPSGDRRVVPSPAAPVVADRRAAPQPTAPSQEPEMIPASARYVQVGAYSDDDNAMIVLRALAARGYPTGQTRSKEGSKPLRAIMAGPFPDRQALIAALNDLRRNGYPSAVAR